jgi:23S rRNA (pseudouridine1915-N3)-methyltransferase
MKINIAAIGKLGKTSPESTLIHNYLKRITWPVTIKEYEEKRPLPSAKLQEIEAEMLLNSVRDSSLVVMLDAGGTQCSSVQFAGYLSKWQTEGAVSFLIGGSTGHGELVKRRANFTLSLSLMTMPHMLARLILVEQLYRSYTIINNHPYNK